MKYALDNFSNEELTFLRNLMQSISPSGKECEATSVIQDYLKYDYHTEIDILGNLYVYAESIRPQSVLLTAHIDEVGFQITRISDNGLVYLRKLGEPDRQTLAGTLLSVCGQTTDLIGAFGKIAPHMQSQTERNQVIDLDSLWVDFGFVSKEEALHYINIGDYLGIAPNFQFDVSGRSCISKGFSR